MLIHAVKVLSASYPLIWNRWVSIQFCCFHCPTIFSSLGSLILGEQIVHIDEFEDKLALSNNKPNFKLTRVPLLLLHYSVFSLHLPFLIFLSVRKPPPQPPEPHFHCFFFPVLLHHHHITIVFPPPPSCYCFHPYSSSTTTTTTFQCVFPPLPPHSNAHFSTNV